tara:strand:- start:1254 stop:1649 length:396 start_codon:yes stop_codon:yes gene_type:complete
MSKKATIGESPKDRSMNIMDKFIKRQEKKNRHKELLPARRKSKDIPIDLWPLKDQIEYWENRTPEQKFQEKYNSYIDWIDKLRDLTGYPDASFNDMISPIKNKLRLKELFSKHMFPKDAYSILQKEGILWV